MANYRTKTQKKNALKGIHQKTRDLYNVGVLSLTDVDKIFGIVSRNL
jgi:hypothetical protein